MDKCSPVEMRKNLCLVDEFVKAGIDFVAIPALSDSDKAALINQQNTALTKAIESCE